MERIGGRIGLAGDHQRNERQNREDNRKPELADRR